MSRFIAFASGTLTRFPAILFLASCLLFLVSGLNAQTKPVVGGVEPMEYTNPILAGFYPDPSVCRVGNDYYLVNSTFAYFPGIPVFHSKDLVNWELIGYVIDGSGVESRYDSLGVSRGIFAPTIRYHVEDPASGNGTFYVTCTFVDAGGNFVCTAKNPAGPWSKPVWLRRVNGIDPSLFFDTDGKAYLVHNSIPPEGKPLYQGHRTIRMCSFDTKMLRVENDEEILVNGGTNINEKPVWIEGPHIFKFHDYYYLICAQGGTAEDHSEVVFRSKNVWGPYDSYKRNPILTQRDLDPDRQGPMTCTGHADFVETPKGTWWSVFLGCQPYPPYPKDYYNTGRETFLAPVTWKEGWPIIIQHCREVAYHYPYPLPPVVGGAKVQYGGEIEYSDNFDSLTLDLNWEFLRAPIAKWYTISEKPGWLGLRLRPETCSEKVNPSFVGRRQQNAGCSASTRMEFLPASDTEKAGLIVFQNETHFYFLCKSKEDGGAAVELYKSTEDSGSSDGMQLLASEKITDNSGQPVYLKIEAHGINYSFLYSFDSESWYTLRDGVDGTFLSTKVAGGFAGCMLALYATSLGKPSGSTAYFDWFKYKGNNETRYK